MRHSTIAGVHQHVCAMEALLEPFDWAFVVDAEVGHPACPSTFDHEIHCGEGSATRSSTGSEFGHLDVTKFFDRYYCIHEATEQNAVTNFDNRYDVHGGLSHDRMLCCHKLGQGLSAGHNEAVADKDPLAIKLEESIGPSRHSHQLGIGDETLGGNAEANGTHSNTQQVYASWRQPGESNSEVGKVIQRAEKSGLLYDLTAVSHTPGFNTVLRCTKSVPASGAFMAAVGKLEAVIGIFLADMHAADPAAVSIIMDAMNEEELAVIDMLLAAMDEAEAVARLDDTETRSTPAKACWKASPLSSSITRQTRINESPKGVIKRLMPIGGTIFFDMDMDSFARAKIDTGVTDCIRKAAIEAAEDFSSQNLGIAFEYTPDSRPKVFSIRYDPELDRKVLAEGFFPSDPRERWHVRVSSLADDRLVFEVNRESMHKIFDHEFAHILGLRHYNAGSDPAELEDPSALWLGTRDEEWNTIMRTGVDSSELQLFEEDFRVIRDLYSKKNGAVVGGVLIVDVNPYKGLWGSFLLRTGVFQNLNRSGMR